MYTTEDYKIIIPSYLACQMFVCAIDLMEEMPENTAENIAIKEYFKRLITLAQAYKNKYIMMKSYSDKTKVIAALAIINLNLN
jgi:hypothetical protein